MLGLALVTVVLSVVDPRLLLGQNIWFKPLKFALSIGLYAVSLSWMIGMLQRLRRFGYWLGTITAVGLAIEMVIITGAASLGTTSHFNMATPLASAAYSVMAISIVIVWIASLIVGSILAFAPHRDAARSLAIRSAVVLGLIGMALASLMTAPQPNQIENFQGVIGAHAVGTTDGGPGIPFLGWSTEAGDLRVPHFIGMHALQFIPLILLLLERLVPCFNVLSKDKTRKTLIGIITASYAATLTLLTGQALAGESVVSPSPMTLTVAALILVATGIAVAITLFPSRATSVA